MGPQKALLKATGDGLQVSPADLTVSAPPEPPRLLGWTGQPDLQARIALIDLACGPAYAASLAAIGDPPVVHEFDGDALIRSAASAGG